MVEGQYVYGSINESLRRHFLFQYVLDLSPKKQVSTSD